MDLIKQTGGVILIVRINFLLIPPGLGLFVVIYLKKKCIFEIMPPVTNCVI